MAELLKKMSEINAVSGNENDIRNLMQCEHSQCCKRNEMIYGKTDVRDKIMLTILRLIQWCVVHIKG